ncbi:MAG: pilus assembly protein [Micropruina sp.]|nr:MAG: pilus assembly protein [Micropruina sp.]QLQ17086.1 MAG: pilus assembly protein [Micropruina sp.]
MTERGVSESVQWSLLVPVLVALVLGLIQTGIWLHGRSVASDAALATAQEVAWARSGDAEAARVGQRVAHAGGMDTVSVTVHRGSGAVQVEVAGSVPVFFDVGQGRISESVVLPMEEQR